MKPRKVTPGGALKHVERPARHNVGCMGVTCCGELRLYITRSPVPHYLDLLAIRCTECGHIVESMGVVGMEAVEPWRDDEDDTNDREGWIG